MNRTTTGIDSLDEMLQGGFPEGSFILLVGRPGTGKTILAHQMMFANAGADSKAIYMTTLAEPQVKVMKFQQEFEFFDHEKIQTSVIYHDLGFILRKHGIPKVLTVIDDLLHQHQPRLIVIDTIKTIADMLSTFTEFREFILDLSLRLATWGCTALFLGEYSEEDIEMRPESAVADGIIYLSGTEDKKQQKRFLRILKMRGTGHTGGEIFFKISRQGIEVFPRLNPEVATQSYIESSERISMGLPGLDQMMAGGFFRGSTTLISGASGTGKTILAFHYAKAGLEQDEPVTFVSFEENPDQIIRTARQLGINLQSSLQAGKLHFMHVSPMELDVDEHVFQIQMLVKKTGSKRLIIDSISSFEIGMRDKVKYTDYIWALTDYFKMQGISVLLTHEMHDSVHHVSELTKYGISFVADNSISLRYQEEGSDVKRYIRIIKMRSSKHLTTLREFKIEENIVMVMDNLN